MDDRIDRHFLHIRLAGDGVLFLPGFFFARDMGALGFGVAQAINGLVFVGHGYVHPRAGHVNFRTL